MSGATGGVTLPEANSAFWEFFPFLSRREIEGFDGDDISEVPESIHFPDFHGQRLDTTHTLCGLEADDWRTETKVVMLGHMNARDMCTECVMTAAEADSAT